MGGVSGVFGAGRGRFQIIGLGLGPGAHHTVALSGPDTPNTIFFWNAGLYGFSDTDGLVGIAGNKTTVLVALPKGIQVAAHNSPMTHPCLSRVSPSQPPGSTSVMTHS